MSARINEKIEEIRGYLDFLESHVPSSLEEYKQSLETKAICERYCEKIIEALVDLAFLFFKEEIIRKDKNIITPKEDTEIFKLLNRKNIISADLSEKLIEAKGMRNIIAHEYGKIDDSIVFKAVSEELEYNVEDFIRAIENTLDKEKENGN